MKWLMTLVLMFCVAFTLAAEETPKPTVRFVPVDVFIDSGDASLAAWQIDFAAAGGDVQLVGVEGGDGAAWKVPPHYDPQALSQSRVILAAINTHGSSPSGRVRVARLHLRVQGTPDYTISLIAAGNADGERIEAEPSVVEGVRP
jgi:hypothetical protein